MDHEKLSATPRILHVAILAIATIISSPAIASDWVKVGVDTESRTWFVDKSSMSRDGDLVRAWKKVEFAQPSPYPPTGELVSVATFLEVTDCFKSITGVKESKLFAPDGSTIASHEDPDDKIQWQAASPGSFLEQLIQFVCTPAADAASQ